MCPSLQRLLYMTCLCGRAGCWQSCVVEVLCGLLSMHVSVCIYWCMCFMYTGGAVLLKQAGPTRIQVKANPNNAEQLGLSRLQANQKRYMPMRYLGVFREPFPSVPVSPVLLYAGPFPLSVLLTLHRHSCSLPNCALHRRSCGFLLATHTRLDCCFICLASQVCQQV